jgi:hypothetical protein
MNKGRTWTNKEGNTEQKYGEAWGELTNRKNPQGNFFQ